MIIRTSYIPASIGLIWSYDVVTEHKQPPVAEALDTPY